MNYLENNKIKDFVKDIVINELHNYKNNSFYGCDLGYGLLEVYNIDGTYFYNNYDAIEFIKENFDDFGEIVEEIKFQFPGRDYLPNVFKEPDSFCVACFLEVATYILGKCKYIDKLWNDEFELTDEVIKIIENELKEV